MDFYIDSTVQYWPPPLLKIRASSLHLYKVHRVFSVSMPDSLFKPPSHLNQWLEDHQFFEVFGWSTENQSAAGKGPITIRWILATWMCRCRLNFNRSLRTETQKSSDVTIVGKQPVKILSHEAFAFAFFELFRH